MSFAKKTASIASMIGRRYNEEPEVSEESKARLRQIVTKQAASVATVVDASEFPGAKSYLAAKKYFAGKKMKPSTAAMLVAAPALPLAVAAAMHLRKKRQQEKTAAFPPALTKSLLGAINGAVAGALIGSRRSLDDQTVRGMVQGALTGALAGGAAAQATGSRAAQFAAGGMGGYLASRGPLGPSRPQVHVRLDQNNTGEAPSATEKMMDVAERIQSKLAMEKIAISDELADWAFNERAKRLSANAGSKSKKEINALGLHGRRIFRRIESSGSKMDKIRGDVAALRKSHDANTAVLNKATASVSKLNNRPGLSMAGKGAIGVATLGAGLYAAHRINKHRKEAP